MRRYIPSLTLWLLLLILSSCATLSRNGVGRVNRYTVESKNLPPEFDGFTIAFLSDIHYPSKFTRTRLGRVVRKLRNLQPQTLLLGGDYVTSDEYIDELFDSLSSVKLPYGIFAVYGNHEFKRAENIKASMEHYGIRLLADDTATISVDDASILLVGIANPFNIDSLKISPKENVPDSLFTILLAHTPDYAQDADVSADIVLSGHTHGGQVSLFGLYTPVTNSRYGSRFLHGMNHTDSGVPVLTTTGVGTSRRKIRFCVPSEIVFITLRRKSV